MGLLRLIRVATLFHEKNSRTFLGYFCLFSWHLFPGICFPTFSIFFMLAHQFLSTAREKKYLFEMPKNPLKLCTMFKKSFLYQMAKIPLKLSTMFKKIPLKLCTMFKKSFLYQMAKIPLKLSAMFKKSFLYQMAKIPLKLSLPCSRKFHLNYQPCSRKFHLNYLPCSRKVSCIKWLKFHLNYLLCSRKYQIDTNPLIWSTMVGKNVEIACIKWLQIHSSCPPWFAQNISLDNKTLISRSLKK